MLARLRFFAKKMPSSEAYSSVRDVYASHKPSLIKGSLTGQRWRYQRMGQTLERITNVQKYKELQQQATANLTLWEKTKSSAPSVVEVVYKDWGVATLEATKKYGVMYSVLNMANSVYPGGAALEGGSAQEENMWLRSTCALSLIDKLVKLDKEYSDTFVYTKEGIELIEARKKMTAKERDILRGRCPIIFPPEVYKTFHSDVPRICFRGPEISLPPTVDDYPSSGHVASPEMSYEFLSPLSIFPFHELRSSTPEHFTEAKPKDPSVLKEYREDLRRRIAAQLDTLILTGQPFVILGAWGCGEFKNDPQLVAEIYAEEIEKRALFFQHIMFPIINTKSHSDNFGVFDRMLTGLKLGDTNSPKSTL
ncbi:TPA: poly(ADP-ribose) glycohydrolase domain-containing protein [Legionella anisa]